MSEGEPAEEEEETVPAGPGEPATEPAQEEGEEEAEEEDEGEEAGEDEGEEESEEEGEGVRALTLDSVEVSDAEILAYLAQYQNDPVKALRAAAELRRAFGRQGTDLAAVRQRVQELEYQAAQARALSAGMTPMTQEQHEWAEGAATRATPAPTSSRRWAQASSASLGPSAPTGHARIRSTPDVPGSGSTPPSSRHTSPRSRSRPTPATSWTRSRRRYQASPSGSRRWSPCSTTSAPSTTSCRRHAPTTSTPRCVPCSTSSRSRRRRAPACRSRRPRSRSVLGLTLLAPGLLLR